MAMKAKIPTVESGFSNAFLKSCLVESIFYRNYLYLGIHDRMQLLSLEFCLIEILL